ncbi:glycosyltransferase [Caulobacter sp. SLTY]|uniref:glycosyltransferase family 2 protein n=1 Tax=Caulobacter sp. SLTY TaxID=2683262 RepID=UPI0014134471|nr:glycosyltransferase family A protein [Caulobacter sp. SLTY]NBB15337.1 glycosyltransferase [Caulobacter sp. SLTY]
MTAPAQDWTIDNPLWDAAKPRLSVLIPFLGDDPVQLAQELAAQSSHIEIVLLDDGGKDPALATRVSEAVQALPAPARFVKLAANVGRAKGRNRLAAQSRAKHLLFLDADMLPDSPAFIADWLALITAQNPAVAFGGFSFDRTPARREHALHRALALRSDCLPPAQRAEAPEKHLFTSNLLVRRDVFDAIAFDERFTGWGWEDVEWGMRVAREHPILHPHIPASHIGLDTAATLARKYEQSAANFARVVEAHPEVVSGYASFKVARAIRRLPGRALLRAAARAAAMAEPLPPKARAFAMRLYRAALYAEVV